MFSTVRSILVVGGGIAGIQACLDLTDSGCFVYLIEKSAFIGGKTAQLDKTYPVNDCPFCIRHNEYIECISRANIEVLTLSEVKNIKGDSGNFHATIIQHTSSGEEEKTITLNVGSVILATGFDSEVPSYCEYIKFPNVITSMEFERIMSLDGPCGGHLIRPSDRKKPRNIAWLQCIGSRDIKHDYCSTVCCMYAVKQASLARRQNRMLNTSIFFMDMRVCGKDHERYYNRAKDEDEVRFVRSGVNSVIPVDGTDDLLIRYADEQGKISEEIYDMVVLSLGLEPSGDAVKLARGLGISLDKNNFVETGSFTPVNTSIPGIYVCGAFNAPKDISESITEAGAAACASLLNIAELRYTAPLDVSVAKTGQKPVAAGLVVGGGVSGMVSTLCLADQGYNVFLIEKTDKLGGHALKLRKTFKGEDVKSYVKELVARVENHDFIDIYLNSEVRDTDGYAGNFKSTISILSSGLSLGLSSGKTKDIRHGVTIISTGANPLKTDEYLYGKNPRVLSWFRLDKMLSEEPDVIKKANVWVFILCVGSREPERPYCSKICCSNALRNALELKNTNPDMEVYVLYRDMRTYGLTENLYTEAREQGIVFVRYNHNNRPVVEEDRDGGLQVQILDNLLGEHIIIQPDFITLQTAIVPGNNENLGRLFKLPVDQDGFFKEAHKKFKPVEFSAKGIYLAGLAHYPKPVDEAISQAQAAAAKAVTVLSKEHIATSNEVASIDLKLCVACLTCARICTSGAVIINGMGKPYVEPAKCRGCGICVVECPVEAISLEP